MQSEDNQFLEEIFQHLIDISKGNCSINDELILHAPNDLHKKILSGLIYLHEDLRLYQKDLVKSLDLEYKMKLLEERNKELSQFTYVASHDLQEPLKTIIGFINLFNEIYAPKVDAEGQKFLQIILDSINRMEQLIKGLLYYSRIGSNSVMTWVDCKKIVKDVLEDLRSAIQSSDAVMDIGCLPELSGYEIELRQLFQNLIYNAIKFRKKGCSPYIKVISERHEDNWLFTVKDNGIGIDMKYKDQIFNIFQRLHRREEYEGIGIGLAHCKKIVELHGGDIWVESRPGAGSSFYFTIPTQQSEAEVQPQ